MLIQLPPTPRWSCQGHCRFTCTGFTNTHTDIFISPPWTFFLWLYHELWNKLLILYSLLARVRDLTFSICLLLYMASTIFSIVTWRKIKQTLKTLTKPLVTTGRYVVLAALRPPWINHNCMWQSGSNISITIPIYIWMIITQATNYRNKNSNQKDRWCISTVLVHKTSKTVGNQTTNQQHEPQVQAQFMEVSVRLCDNALRPVYLLLPVCSCFHCKYQRCMW